jgi:hypothetical protein
MSWKFISDGRSAEVNQNKPFKKKMAKKIVKKVYFNIVDAIITIFLKLSIVGYHTLISPGGQEPFLDSRGNFL